MKSYYIVTFVLYFSALCISQILNCETLYESSGEISYKRFSYYRDRRCWTIKVPEGSYVRLERLQSNFQTRKCWAEYLQITLANTGEDYTFCSMDRNINPITALKDVNIVYYYDNYGTTNWYWRTTGYRGISSNWWDYASSPSYENWRITKNWRNFRETTLSWNWPTSRYGTYNPRYRSTESYRWYTPSTASYDDYTFRLHYKIESLICTQNDSFRCSDSQCVYDYQVCNGVADCENGTDEISCETGVTAIKGVDVSRKNAVRWLKNHRTPSFGWGKNTPRAITALYLSGGASFRGENLDEDLMVKQLELQTAVALLRDRSDAITVNDLSMFINALLVTCHNPGQFYGYNLLVALEEMVMANQNSPSPGAYLTLCNANRKISESSIKHLLSFLNEPSGSPFDLDIEAMTVLALTCMKNKANIGENAIKMHNTTIQKFMNLQKSDGSFGNIYTSALITQVLIANEQESNTAWNLTAAVKYLMSVSPNFLSTYLAAPLFNGKTLVDISSVKCNISRKQGEDEEIYDITEQLGGKIKIKYSLYNDDRKDIMHSLYLRMPENSSAYDVMKVAQVVDSKYKFSHSDSSGYMYVYEIAEITNDIETGKFWQLYTGQLSGNSTLKISSESPDKIVLEDGQHLVMWYKAVNLQQKEADLNNIFRKLLLHASQ